MKLPGLSIPDPALPADPAQPAQPVQPITPDQLGQNTGGFTGPQPSGQGFQGPIPGGQPPASSPSIPSQSGAGPQVAPSPAGPGGVPAAAAAAGIDPGAYSAILDDLHKSTDPEMFKTQFAQLMDWRPLLAGPTGIDPRGYHIPSKDQLKFYKSWMTQAVAYLSGPESAGGKAMTLPQARLMAITEARKRWPQIPPQVMTEIIPKGKKYELTDAVGFGKNQPKVEFGVQRAARISPAKIADILTRKEFKTALDWANAYKDQAGPGANAIDYAKYVWNQQHAKQVASVAAKAEADPSFKKPSAASIAQAVNEWFAQNAHVFSVAASVGQLV